MRVSAYNKTGWSEPGPVSRMVMVPDAPQLRNANPTSLRVSWAEPTVAEGSVTRYQVQIQPHVGDQLHGCQDERERHAYAQAVAQAQAELQDQLDSERLASSARLPRHIEDTFRSRTAFGTSRVALSNSSSLLSKEQRMELWLKSKVKELTSSFRELRDGFAATLDLDCGGEWVPVGADGESPRRATRRGRSRTRTRRVVGEHKRRGREEGEKEGGEEAPDWISSRHIVASGLQPGSRYRFRVRHYHDAGGWSPWDEAPLSGWFRTDDVVPSTIEQPEATAVTPESVVVRWRLPRGNGSACKSFHLQRRRIRAGGTQDDSDSDWEEGGGGPDYDWVDVGTHLPIATCLSTASQHAQRFADASNAGTSRDPDPEFPLLAAVVEALRPGTRHEFRVAARNDVGCGAPSIASEVCKTHPVTPTTPQPPQPTALSSNKVSISWRPPRSMGSTIHRWQMQRRRTGLSHHPESAKKQGAGPDGAVEDPDPVTGDGWVMVPLSKVAKEELDVLEHLQAPAQGAAAASPSTRGSAVQVDMWARDAEEPPSMSVPTPRTQAAAVIEQRQRHRNRQGAYTRYTAIEQHQFAGSRHTYRVRCRNECGWSAWSEVSPSVRLHAGLPLPPMPPVVLPLDPHTVFVGWIPPHDNGAVISAYRLQRRRIRTRRSKWRERSMVQVDGDSESDAGSDADSVVGLAAAMADGGRPRLGPSVSRPHSRGFSPPRSRIGSPFVSPRSRTPTSAPQGRSLSASPSPSRRSSMKSRSGRNSRSSSLVRCVHWWLAWTSRVRNHVASHVVALSGFKVLTT